MGENKPKTFILDVDGVMTSGHFLYSSEGKIAKIFGADDNDALSLLKPLLNIQFVTGDRKGYEISKKRIQTDMGFKLDLVSTIKRVEWIRSFYEISEVIYMGDGIFDYIVMKEVFYSIAPSNADPNAKKFANFVTQRSGANRAVSEACLHIMEKFFGGFDEKNPFPKGHKLSGEWTV